jgi:hypothetical protein
MLGKHLKKQTFVEFAANYGIKMSTIANYMHLALVSRQVLAPANQCPLPCAHPWLQGILDGGLFLILSQSLAGV